MKEMHDCTESRGRRKISQSRTRTARARMDVVKARELTFVRRASLGHGSEAHDVREDDCDRLVQGRQRSAEFLCCGQLAQRSCWSRSLRIRHDLVHCEKILCDGLGKDRVNERVLLLLFLLQGLLPLLTDHLEHLLVEERPPVGPVGHKSNEENADCNQHW